MPRSFMLLRLTFSPKNEISPLSAFSKPAIIRSSVVLPLPLGPKSAVSSPLFISKFTFLSATKSPKFLFKFDIFIPI